MNMHRFLSVALLALSILSTQAEEFELRTYRKVGDVELSLRLYKPEGWKATDQRPAAIFFFGGGWRNGNPKQFHQHCLHLAGKGFVAMSADYRVKSRHNTMPWDSTEDALAAVKWVHTHAGELGIDPKRVAAGGGSAGGHLAAATATLGKGKEIPEALILFNPALNLLYKELPEKIEADRAKLKDISPFHHIAKNLPPSVIFHGDKDTSVPYPSIVEFVEKAEKLGAKKPLLHTYEGRPHTFFNYGKNDNKDYEDTIVKMDAFLVELGWLKE